MIFHEIKGDLFTASENHFFVQCISSDLVMGAGIAVKFNEHFDVKNKINKLFSPPNNFTKGYCLWDMDRTYCLVTKKNYYDKPTYETLRESLISMRDSYMVGFDQTDRHKVYIASPRIGCGLDKLEWDKVKMIILDVFRDANIEWTVYSL